MKFLLTFAFIACSLPLMADVFIDPRIRPCDDQLASEYTYTPVPVHAPGTPRMSFRCEGDVKVFEITAEEVMSTLDEMYEPGPVYTWGYNGSNPGPVMEIMEGEKIRVIFKNKLPEASSIHWHGIHLPYNQDGVSGSSQPAVKPGETFVYEWPANQSGTYMYHAHNNSAKQLSMGMVGFLIIHPKKVPETMVDHDILYFLQMFALPPHSIYPDVMEMMMFNYFTMNGKSAPYIPPVTVYKGQKVRIRFANMSMMEHPAHLHGMSWRVVATGSGDNPRSSHTYGNTVLVGTAQTIDVIVDEITNPGEWMLHCHLPHHVTNNMDVDIIPGEPMYMADGGMHTQLIVHRGPNDPGYQNAPSENGETGGAHGGSHGGGHGDMIAPKITTYDGQIRLSNGIRLDTTLELFKAQEDKDWRKLKAFLKVYLSKDEFLVYEYEQVKYNFETGLMALESDEKSITLSNLTFMDHGDIGMLSGDASVDFGSLKGTIQLETRDPEMRDIRLKTNLSLTGEYTGTCAGKPCNLQLLTARDFKSDEGANNPLAKFSITGSLGTQLGSTIMVDGFVKEAFYDPFRSEVSLKLDNAGVLKALTCRPTIKSFKINGLDCGDSKFTLTDSLTQKISTVTGSPAKFAPDSTLKVTELSSPKDLDGNYFGALELASSSTVVPFNLKIVAKRYATNSMVITKNMVSGVAELIFGKSSLAFKLKERPFLDSSSSVNDNKNLLLFESTAQLSIVINRWSKDAISGEAYHSSYGHIGRFQVTKNASSMPFLPTVQPALLPIVDGEYKNEFWALNIQSSQYEDGASNNVYAPLHIKGSLKMNNNGPLIQIVNGTYDFILGVLQLETDEGRMIKGYINQGEIELLLPSKPLKRSKYLNLKDSRIILKKASP